MCGLGVVAGNEHGPGDGGGDGTHEGGTTEPAAHVGTALCGHVAHRAAGLPAAHDHALVAIATRLFHRNIGTTILSAVFHRRI